MAVLILVVLAVVAGLVAPVDAQSPADRTIAELAREEARAAELADPGVRGPAWLPNDPDRPSEEDLAAIDSGPGLFDPGPSVLPEIAADEVRRGVETAERTAPRPVDAGPQPVDAAFVGSASDRRVVPPIVAAERVEFDSAPSERAPGRAPAGSVLEDRVRLSRPEGAGGGGVALQVTPAKVTERVSTAGLAFGVETGEPVGVGDASRLDVPDGKVDLGEATGWALEFDLGLFADVLADPTTVDFVVNIGCDESGVCADREFLETSVDFEAWTATVDLPANVLAGADRIASRPATPAVDGTAGGAAGDGLSAGIVRPGLAGFVLAQGGGGPGGGLIIGAVQGPTGAGGSYTASRLKSVASWQVGLQTGYAELQYPLDLPAAPGPVPNLDLGYSSGAVEGIGSTENGQPPRVGLGWSEPTSVITRTTRACNPNPDRLCAAFGRHDGFSLSFNGVSSPLVRLTPDAGVAHPDYPPGAGVTMWEYILESRNDWRVRRVEQPSSFTSSSTSNGDGWGTWWEVTTGDGTLYVFGRERVFDPTVGSGPATTWERTGVHSSPVLKSLLSAPLVFPVGDPDRPPNGCTASFCELGIVWHLDQVVDTSGNRAVYYYDSVRNNFVPNQWNTMIPYDREVWLESVHWGQRSDAAPPQASGWSPFKTSFTYGGRYDIPDFGCTSVSDPSCQRMPSFYSDKTLDKILVAVNNVTEYGWDLDYHVAQNDPAVWLNEIQRIEPGGGGYVASIPPVSFTKAHLDNAVTGGFAYNRPRVASMTTEAGATITFTYDQPYGPSSSSSDPCYKWSADEVRRPCNMYPSPESFSQGDNGTLIWWHQYVVSQVRVSVGSEANSPDMVTSYTYDTPPDWAWQARYPGAGEWNDYRGHRQVTVDDGSGTTVTHYFATGMWDDHNSETDSSALGSVSPSTAPAIAQDPWGTVDNRLAIAGSELGSTETRNGLTQSNDVTRLEWAPVAGSQTPTDFADPSRITKTTDYSEIFDSASATWTAQTKVESFFDDYQRITKTIDHGQTVPVLTGDERTTVYGYDDRTGPWLMGLVDEVDTHDGTSTSGDVIGSVDSTYDSLGRLSETATQRASNDPDRQRTTFTYTSKGQPDTVTAQGDNATSADDQVTAYDYDPTYGWLKEIDGPLGGSPDPDTYQQTIDPVFGVTTQTVDPNGRVTDLTYDSLGRLLTVRLPDTPSGFDSYEFEYSVDQSAVDRVRTRQLVDVSATDKYAISWEFFDGLGRVIQAQSRHQGDDGQVAVVSTNYDAVGRSWHTTRPVFRTATPGSYYSENWSSLGVAHAVSTYPAVTTSSVRSEGCDDGINTETSFRTAAQTEWATSLATTCGLTSRSWNRDGQLAKSVADVRGNQVSATDTGGNTTTFEYNVRDQLVEVTDPASNTTTYQFANWNGYGPTQVDDPDHGISTLTYDDFGRLDHTVDARGVELARGYDDANRLRNVWYVDGASMLDVAEYTYDLAGGLGQLGEATSWNRDTAGSSAGQTSVAYTYDGRGRTDTITHDIPGLPGGPRTVSYDYYEHDRPFHVTYPGGMDLEYAYDRQGRPAWLGLTDPNNTAQPGTRTVVLYTEYNAADRLATLKRRDPASAGALNTYYGFNDWDGSVHDSYTDSGPSTPLDQYFVYDYSDQGRVSSVFEQAPSGSTTTCFSYTGENFLSKAWTLGNSTDCQNVGSDNAGPEPFEVDYSYDSQGRITSATGTGTVGGSYTYSGSGPLHAPTAAGGNSYGYDPAGNRTAATVGGQTTNYAYDVQDRLLTTSGADTAAMLYDTGGERVKRTINGATDYYLAAGLEVDASGNQTVAVSFAGRLVATYTSGYEIWSQNTDHLGTPTFSVTVAGTDEYYRRYTPFGAPRSAASSTGDPSDLTFTGQRDDTDLGLMYYGARYYDPTLGQFTQPDTIVPTAGLGVDWNRYTYVRNNPASLADPTGREPCRGGGRGCPATAVNVARGLPRNYGIPRRTQHIAAINTNLPTRLRPQDPEPPASQPASPATSSFAPAAVAVAILSNSAGGLEVVKVPGPRGARGGSVLKTPLLAAGELIEDSPSYATKTDTRGGEIVLRSLKNPGKIGVFRVGRGALVAADLYFTGKESYEKYGTSEDAILRTGASYSLGSYGAAEGCAAGTAVGGPWGCVAGGAFLGIASSEAGKRGYDVVRPAAVDAHKSFWEGLYHGLTRRPGG